MKVLVARRTWFLLASILAQRTPFLVTTASPRKRRYFQAAAFGAGADNSTARATERTCRPAGAARARPHSGPQPKPWWSAHIFGRL